MCRNIRVLHHFKPPTTDEEIRAAALQYVRKVSGLAKVPVVPASGANGERKREGDAERRRAAKAFERAVLQVAASTKVLLGQLPERGEARTREGEREKARARFRARSA
ncbi:MAG: DUF2277 domain-containing protein [Myxococcales bacterium]|nr:DUF2277 domain-containing protein [Myxococcales bacterium]